ncbi:MAG: glycosyltransferase [Chloroflexi bacterium]|nr:glycosyltransferase [Chloroflexota bacterium]
MKVLYFSRDYATHDHRFLAAIVEAGHEAHFLRLEQRGPRLEERHFPEGAIEIEWDGGQGPFAWSRAPHLVRSLRRVIQHLQPDLIHAGPLHTCGALAARAGFHPLALMSWGSDILREAQQSTRAASNIRFALGQADALMADCMAVEDAAAQFDFPRTSVVRFAWGVDLEKFSPLEETSPLRERLGWENAFVMLHTRAWEPLYGVLALAQSFVRAAQQHEGLRLLLLGNGSLEQETKSVFEQGRVLDRVHFAGQVSQSELPAYYQAADLYLSASHSDGSSVSLMEALASGLPALVSDIPGNREWIEPGAQGWLFPVDDADALAAAILHAAQEETDFSAMRHTARARAEERADWQQNKLGIQRAYELARLHA